MQLTLHNAFDCSAERCFSEVQKPALMQHIAKPLVHFVPRNPVQLPALWEAKDYIVSLRLFGWLPIGAQLVRISGQDHSARDGTFSVELRDNGCGTLVRRWDHRIFIRDASTPGAPDQCSYTDQVDIQAGLLTPIVAAFAWFFYRHRQKRWKQLIRKEFAYD